jgi:hypothetical protein
MLAGKDWKDFQSCFFTNYKLLEGRGGKVGWKIVIPMPEALNYVERPQAKNLFCFNFSHLVTRMSGH